MPTARVYARSMAPARFPRALSQLPEVEQRRGRRALAEADLGRQEFEHQRIVHCCLARAIEHAAHLACLREVHLYLLIVDRQLDEAFFRAVADDRGGDDADGRVAHDSFSLTTTAVRRSRSASHVLIA